MTKGFIDARLDFDKNRGITRLEALKVLLKLKGINTTTRVTPSFRKMAQGISSRSKNLGVFEAGYASKILEDSDIKPVRPLGLLSRRDFATWVWRFNDHGIKKSKLDSSFDKDKYLKEKQELEKRDTEDDFEEA